ncbi:MAG: hypothetical protein ABI690_03610 [Chloroflexota bacterium]
MGSLLLNISIFSFSLWLGFYLLSRDPRKPRLRYTGLGLIAYGLEIAGFSVVFNSEFFVADFIKLIFLPGISHLIPAVLWFSASADFLPDNHPLRPRLGILVVILVVSVGLVARFIDGPAYLIVVMTVFPLWFVWQAYRAARSKRTLGALMVVTIFFGLSNSLLIFPANLILQGWILLAIEIDLVLLGLLIAVLDAFDEGETLLPDMLYSFTISAVMAVLFGGQVALAMVFAGGVTPPLLILLYGLVTAAIATQIFYSGIQSLIDRLVFARLTRIRLARADLRAAASSLPRLNESLDFADMDAAEFARLTRRALSHFGDLSRLSSSPLTRLPIINHRLAARGAPDNTLERAAELKLLLTEGIARLKPRDKGQSGTSDEWRYYNALYYPYVLGLKIYTLNGQQETLDSAAKTTLDWFQLFVPERTLHNWQNAAARLIAQDLREQLS